MILQQQKTLTYFFEHFKVKTLRQVLDMLVRPNQVHLLVLSECNFDKFKFLGFLTFPL
jgi:hypothetical protein